MNEKLSTMSKDDLIKLAAELRVIYGTQSQNSIDGYPVLHDDSGGHPDYHCDQHDNTPGGEEVVENRGYGLGRVG